ncbi:MULTISPECIES: hypothetical protein [unclassified Novosphingobium]|uniref:hypothetical protein n=1 Tax=unclassified Novosphingobium TaxID=2644732 RepID=UPI001F41B9C3|nr:MULTISPECIES: hypothetical protein [unclassified Novosphingobium]
MPNDLTNRPAFRPLLPPLLAAATCVIPMTAAADPAPFELTGPDLQIEVTRGEKTLPIAKVPSLAAGDKVVVRGAFSEDQGANFVLVSAFLRGATNPPPKDWIDIARTWKSKDKDKALTLTVPKGARQLVLLMVPETGGAEGALVDAVRGKPGEFVRASQDLNQASLDHSRLIAFMAAVRAQDDNGPEYLRTVAPTLANSLSIKLQADCLSKVIEQQASCLVQNRESLVLSDVHSSSIADTLTGTPTDLALQLSATREAGAGYYSAYIGVARDIARIFGAFSNPSFNYLPTLSVRNDETMSLLLNAAPSFQKPKSVMVTALPAIEADIPPQLRGTAKAPICAAETGAVLPVEGAPLVFSTQFAHAMQVRLTSASGQVLEVAATPRADKGGYQLAAESLPAAFTGTVRAHLHGLWGFAGFEGPDFVLQRPDGGAWKVAGQDAADGMIVGRDNEVALEGSAPSCVEEVTLRQGNGAAMPLKWRAVQDNRLALTVPLEGARPGDMRIEVRYQGAKEPAAVTLRARAEASRLDALELHAGDTHASLTGQRLDQVRTLMVGNVEFRPDGLTREGAVDRLRLTAQGTGHAPDQGDAAKAIVKLEDGRSLPMQVRVAPPRPQVSLLNRTVNPAAVAKGARALDLGAAGDLLPDTGELVFSVKAGGGMKLGALDTVEIAAADGESVVRLGAGKGLTLEGPEVLVARLKGADIPAGTFGPLRFRLLRGGATAGDWQPLATLVRLPGIEDVVCEAEECTITARSLFLVDAVGADAGFAKAATVPPGYTGSALKVPKPADGVLYLRLRDAPGTPVKLPVG